MRRRSSTTPARSRSLFLTGGKPLLPFGALLADALLADNRARDAQQRDPLRLLLGIAFAQRLGLFEEVGDLGGCLWRDDRGL